MLLVCQFQYNICLFWIVYQSASFIQVPILARHCDRLETTQSEPNGKKMGKLREVS